MPLPNTTKLFSPYQIKEHTFKNRLVMSPMCMYSVDDCDGIVTDFHYIHYTSCALGQVGLIIQEATAVVPEGRITERDLGIWDNVHVPKLQELVSAVHGYGAKMGIQLAHAGRKAELDTCYAPSAIAYSADYQTPKELTNEDIKYIIGAFQDAAIRAKEIGYDVLEIHAAHGYLIHQFLSPVTNKRTDAYGGSKENQFRLLKEITQAIKDVWSGPLLVRISAEEYTDGGYTTADYVEYCQWLKKLEVDLIDVSSGGLMPHAPKAFPGYQVPFAQEIKNEAGIATGAVGLILDGQQAEAILASEQADLVFIGRPLLRTPNFAIDAAKQLGLPYDGPYQYERGFK